MVSSGINKIGIIGAGRMGTDIFNFLTAFDYELVLICIDDAESQTLQQSFEKRIRRQHKCGILNEQQLLAKQQSVVISHQINSLENCDLIIECIWEDIAKKKLMYQEIIPVIKSSCILASNSSSFLPSQLLPCATMIQRFVGLHFFYPVKLKNIVELITPGSISAETITALKDFCRKTEKKPLVQDEKNAFWLNKLFLEVQNEAFCIAAEGKMSYEEIDTIVSEQLFPEGIFRFFDQVGIDIMLQSIRNYTASNSAPYQLMIAKLESLQSKKHLGVKTRDGFYHYEEPRTGTDKRSLPENQHITEVLARLKKAYTGKAQQLINEGACDKETLDYAAKEYMNTDKGPFDLG